MPRRGSLTVTKRKPGTKPKKKAAPKVKTMPKKKAAPKRKTMVFSQDYAERGGRKHTATKQRAQMRASSNKTARKRASEKRRASTARRK